MQTDWFNKPYYSLDAFLKEKYHEKIYKIAIDANMTCPNRDGTLGNNGCIFCGEVGSGDFAIKKEVSVQKQIELGKNLFQTKKIGNKFIAYFQSFTNTYAPISYLEQIYTEELNVPEVIGLSIATRPDCISMPIIALI